MIYFIQQNPEENGPVKIGISKDPQRRLDTLQTGSPHELELIYTARVAAESECEDYLHEMWSSRRLNGEWFDIGLLFEGRSPAFLIGDLPASYVFEDCAFCGEEIPIYHQIENASDDESHAYYQCYDCGCRSPSQPLSDLAANAWNRMQQAIKQHD
jgi:hypothetical protein